VRDPERSHAGLRRANVAGSSFCGNCGTSLATAEPCPQCGSENAPGQAFCNSCGTSLKQPPVEEAAATVDAASVDGERKQVTVLFADVMGSMDMAEQVDPDEWRQIMQQFFSLLSDGVRRFEGTVDKFTGDGIMALFERRLRTKTRWRACGALHTASWSPSTHRAAASRD
jgi:hypothetical protein